jgi:tRNA modification GTPase
MTPTSNIVAPTDTIAAIATPHGRGGVGIIRISGPAASAIATAITERKLAPRIATVTHVFREQARTA